MHLRRGDVDQATFGLGLSRPLNMFLLLIYHGKDLEQV